MLKKIVSSGKKVFTPIARLNDWYTYKDGDKILLIPEMSIL